MLEVHVVEMMRELVETLKILISERRKRSPVPQLPESIVVIVKAVLKQRISERITAAHFPSKESVHELPQVQDVFETTVHGASGASGSSGLLGWGVSDHSDTTGKSVSDAKSLGNQPRRFRGERAFVVGFVGIFCSSVRP